MSLIRMGAQLMGWRCASKQSSVQETTSTPVNWCPKMAKSALRFPPSPQLPSMSGLRLVEGLFMINHMQQSQKVNDKFAFQQTKVTSIDDRTVGDQYLPNYLSITSWYSPSMCHIQIQSPSKLLKVWHLIIKKHVTSYKDFLIKLTKSVCRFVQVGQEAEVALKSTCPCNFTLHYEVASRGNIVLSGKQQANATATRREKRATVTFDKNTHATQSPPSSSGSVSCDHFNHFWRFAS